MAKKTSKTKATENVAEEATVQTIASKAAAKLAERIFKQNPDIKEAHITSDGTAFYGRNDAQNHANTLSNREVFSFKRGNPELTTNAKTASNSTETTAPASNPSVTDNADTGEEIDELTGEVVNDETANTEE